MGIELLRNQEVRRPVLASLLLGIAGSGICFLLEPVSGFVALVMCCVLLCFFIGLTRQRYRELATLANRLSRIADGEVVLLADATEGELSILLSELDKIIRTLTYQKQRIERDKTFLADALSDISHQLKTPLTSLTMMADLLNHPDLSPAKRDEFTENIRLGLSQMHWLVTSLLKLSRLDAGAVVFQPELADVKSLIEEAAAPLMIPMEIKNQKFTVSGSPDISLSGDRRWLMEALGNIIKNCVEHTPEGGEIQLHYQKTALYLRIEISDTGKGIPPEDLPHIFERFYKGKQAGADSVGIGLALSKTIIHQQGGTIDAESSLQKGSRFIIKFYA